jgi:DNA adenine methylase
MIVVKKMKIKIPYKQYGGKASIAKWIVSYFPEHKAYLEPCCGSAAVLLAKPMSPIELLNDLDSQIMNMWRAIKSHPTELAALLWATPYATANWREQFLSSDLEETALLIAQSAQFYCGNRNSSTWSADACLAPHKPKSQVWADWFLRILPVANRLRGVQLLNEDALKAIERIYKRGPEALIYVDPPYLGHENEYCYQIDYSGMAELLRQATAKVVISEYPSAKHFFPDWNCITKTTASRAGTGRHKYSGKRKIEVLFTNF